MNDSIPDKKRKVFAILLDSLLALRRENKEIIYSSMLKDTIKRKKPSFNEGYYGYRTFSELLEDAQRDGLLELDKHKSSGMYVVTRFGLELTSGTVSQPSTRPLPPPHRNGGEPKRVIELPPPRNGGEPKRAIELPPRNGGEPKKVLELPPRNAEPKPAEAPKPIPLAEKRAAVAPAPKPQPPADEREENDRPLGRALVDEFDGLDDDDSLDEVPSYAPRKAEPKPVARPAAAAKPVAKPVENDPAPAPAAGAPKRTSRAATKVAPKAAAKEAPAEAPPRPPRATPRRRHRPPSPSAASAP
jgi:hypothetical protein